MINKLVLGAGNENVPRILRIFAHAFSKEAIDPAKPEGVRILNIIRQVQSNEQVFQNIVTNFSADLQQALHVALNTTPCS